MGQPLYQQVAAHIRGQITRGELLPGDALPTEPELVSQAGDWVGRRTVGLNTVRNALRELVNEGLITEGSGRAGRRVRQRRILTYYAARSEHSAQRQAASADAWVTDVREQGHEPGQTIHVETVQADPELARMLDIEPGTDVVVRRRIRTVDGEVDNLNDSYYPPAVAGDVPEITSPATVPQGVIALMAERGHREARLVDELTWRPPTPDERTTLALSAGVSVLTQTRITFSTAGQVLRVAVTTWPGDRHRLIYELPA